MSTITLDIETIPSGVPIDPLSMDPPKTMKKKETIDNWFQTEAKAASDEEFRGRALKSVRGEIITIGWKLDDGNTRVLQRGIDCDSERELVAAWWDIVKNSINEREGIQWVGHNALNFDTLWLRHRAMKYRIPTLKRQIRTNPWKGNVFDTMLEFNEGNPRAPYISLSDLADFLGVEHHKDTMDGSMVFDAWNAGEYARIAKYCIADVELTHDVYCIQNM